MDEASRQGEIDTESIEAAMEGVVLPFPTSRPARPGPRPPAVTAAEILEYRAMLPLLRQMLKEWKRIRTTCPMAMRLTDD